MSTKERRWLVEINYQTLCTEDMVQTLVDGIEAKGGTVENLEWNVQQFQISINPCSPEDAVKFEGFLRKKKTDGSIKFWSRSVPGSPKKKRRSSKVTVAVKNFVRNTAK
jgi:hypothetical protein